MLFGAFPECRVLSKEPCFSHTDLASHFSDSASRATCSVVREDELCIITDSVIAR